jgi:N-acetylmuramoyl-L-alanine amidase
MRFSRFSHALWGTGLLLITQLAGAATLVQKVDLQQQSTTGARLVLTLSAPVGQNVFSLSNPERLVVDLPATRLASGVRMPRAAGPVKSVRSGMQSKTLRLVLELDRALTPNVHVGDHELTVDMGIAPVVAPAPAIPVPVHPAHAPGDTGRDVVVAVDAGHGGQDPGATGRSGTREKDVVLAIARALAKRINAEPGMHAVLTRDSDRFIPLR